MSESISNHKNRFSDNFLLDELKYSLPRSVTQLFTDSEFPI